MWRKITEGNQSSNPANTSVLCMKNSPNLLALCEAGQPYVIRKQDLKNEGFSDFG